MEQPTVVLVDMFVTGKSQWPERHASLERRLHDRSLHLAPTRIEILCGSDTHRFDRPRNVWRSAHEREATTCDVDANPSSSIENACGDATRSLDLTRGCLRSNTGSDADERHREERGEFIDVDIIADVA